MTIADELWMIIIKPGVTLADFNMPLTPQQEKEWADRLVESRQRQKEALARKNAPFKNHRITV